MDTLESKIKSLQKEEGLLYLREHGLVPVIKYEGIEVKYVKKITDTESNNIFIQESDIIYNNKVLLHQLLAGITVVIYK